MDCKKRKSILLTQFSKDDDVNNDLRPKRVSFCGKKSVREFNCEGKDFEYDYELSDRVDSTTNSSVKSNLTSSEIKLLGFSTALCTTQEFINKSDQGTLYIENSLDVTLLSSEKNKIKSTKLQSKESRNIMETTETIVKSPNQKTDENNFKQKNSNTEDYTKANENKFIYFNENSNKENIMPKSDFVTADGLMSKPSNDDGNKTNLLLSESDENFELRSFHQDLQRISEHVEPKQQKIDIISQPAEQGEELPTTLGNMHEHQKCKAPKVIVRHITTPMKLSKSIHEQNLKKAQQQQKIEKKSTIDNFSDVSGIIPIADSPISCRMETSAESSPLLPPEYLIVGNKKANLQQLNADMASGKIKLFENMNSRTMYCNKNLIFPPSINTKKAKKDSIDIELENTFCHKNQNETNSKCVDIEEESLQPAITNGALKRQTILYHDEIIEREVTTQKNHLISESVIKPVEITEVNSMNKEHKCKSSKNIEPIPAKLINETKLDDTPLQIEDPEDRADLQNANITKTTLSSTIMFENEGMGLHSDQKAKIVEDMEISTLIKKDEIPFKEANHRRGTIFFSNESIQQHQTSCSVNPNQLEETLAISINHNENEEIAGKCSTRRTQFFEDDDFMNVTNEKIESPKLRKRRCTQHFDENIVLENQTENFNYTNSPLEMNSKKYTGAIPKLSFLRKQQTLINSSDMTVKQSEIIETQKSLNTVEDISKLTCLRKPENIEFKSSETTEKPSEDEVEPRSSFSIVKKTLKLPFFKEHDDTVTQAIFNSSDKRENPSENIEPQSNFNIVKDTPKLEILKESDGKVMQTEVVNSSDTKEKPAKINEPLSSSSIVEDTLTFRQRVATEELKHNTPVQIGVLSKKLINLHFIDKQIETADVSIESKENVSIKARQKVINMNKPMNLLMTPISVARKRFPLTPGTPHRSLLEFEELEALEKKRTQHFENVDPEEEGIQKENKTDFNTSLQMEITECESFAISKACWKRDTTNLTPNLPNSKKRQSYAPQNFNTNIEIVEEVGSKNCVTKHFNEQMDLDIDETEVQQKSTIKFHARNRLTFCNFDNSTEEAIDHTEPPSFFEITEVTAENTKSLERQNLQKTLQISAQEAITPSRIPVLIGGTKRKSGASVSSPNMQELQNLDFLDTIEEGRFITTIKNGDVTKKRSIFENEDVPITISDVSQHYLSMRKRQTFTSHQNSRRSDAEKAAAKNELAEMRQCLDIIDDPEKLEAFSNSLIDECEDVELAAMSFNFKATEAIAKIETAAAEAEMGSEDCYKQKALICRKCKHCQDSLLNETVSTEATDSFVMPAIPPLSSLGLFDKLEKLEKNSISMEDAIKFVQQLKLQNPENIFEKTDYGLESEEEYEDNFLKEFYAESKRLDEELKKWRQNYVHIPISFVDQLEQLMNGPMAQNWILNTELRRRKILTCHHRKFISFVIVVQYEDTARFGANVNIVRIKLEEESVKTGWVPFDFIALFQLKLELPMDLTSLCAENTARAIFEMFQNIDDICIDVDNLARDLWAITAKHESKLIRENNRNFVQKKVRKIVELDGFYHHTETTEFRIEVMHIRKLNFKNIITPALFLFKEDIEKLPVGLNFLEIFLPDPASFLSKNNESSEMSS